MALGLLFPGQGAQFVGMGQELYDAYPEARAVFEEASDALGFDVPKICFEGPDEVLNATAFTQPVLLTACIAAYMVWSRRVSCPVKLAAGLSLGEYAALVAAKSLSFADAVELTRLRGVAMQEAVPRGVGAMAAIIGLEASTVEQICGEVSTPDVWAQPANYNCPGQIVISGHTAAVKAACAAAKAGGATRALVLPVSAPFHTPLLAPAAEKLALALDSVTISDPQVPVVANVSAKPLLRAEEIRQALVQQVIRPVLLEQSLRYMMDQGIEAFVELGPGGTMTKFVRKVSDSAKVVSVHDPATLNEALQHSSSSVG